MEPMMLWRRSCARFRARIGTRCCLDPVYKHQMVCHASSQTLVLVHGAQFADATQATCAYRHQQIPEQALSDHPKI